MPPLERDTVEGTIIHELASRDDACVEIGGDVISVELLDYGVKATFERAGKYIWEGTIVSENHDPITIRCGTADTSGSAWCCIERLVDECDRVGEWLVGEDIESMVNPTKEFREFTESEVDEWRRLSSESQRQRKRVKNPRRGIKLDPEDPVDYYPWNQPFVRPIVYDYTGCGVEECPVCGGYARTQGYPYGVGCATHGGFIVCDVSDGWVRDDHSKYRDEIPGTRHPDAVKIVRDGDTVTVKPHLGGGVKPKDVRHHGYDMASRSENQYDDLWTGTRIDTGDTVIFSKAEVVATKPTDPPVEGKPWVGDEKYDLMENEAEAFGSRNSRTLYKTDT